MSGENEINFEEAAAEIAGELWDSDPVVAEADSLEIAGSGDAADSIELGDVELGETGKPATEGKTEQPPATQELLAKPAPKTWKPEVAEKWSTLAPEVQDEILRREEDIFKGIESYKAEAEIGREFRNVIQPYLGMYQQYGMDPRQHIGSLMQMHAVMLQGSPEQKAQLLDGLSRQFGVQRGVQAEPAFIDPELDNVKAELAKVRQEQQRFVQEAQQVKVAETSKTIEEFAADPKNLYFNELVNDIAALFEAKVVKTLPEAYEKALWANPVTRAKLQADLEAKAKTAAIAEQQSKAEQAKRATAANLSQRSRPVSGTAKVVNMEETLGAAYDAIMSRK